MRFKLLWSVYKTNKIKGYNMSLFMEIQTEKVYNDLDEIIAIRKSYVFYDDIAFIKDELIKKDDSVLLTTTITQLNGVVVTTESTLSKNTDLINYKSKELKLFLNYKKNKKLCYMKNQLSKEV